VPAEFCSHRLDHLRVEARAILFKHRPLEDRFHLVTNQGHKSIERIPENGVVPQKYPQHATGYLKVSFHRIT
jgi:hypothetical protein